MSKKSDDAAKSKILRKYFERMARIQFLPKGPYDHQLFLTINDLEELKHAEIMSKDVMLGNVEDSMGPYLQTDLDIINMLSAYSKNDPLLEQYYIDRSRRMVAEYRATRSIGGFERRGQGSPSGDMLNMHVQSYNAQQEQPQQKGGGLFDFMKGKKILGGQGADTSIRSPDTRW